jgi:hypothetical protein
MKQCKRICESKKQSLRAEVIGLEANNGKLQRELILWKRIAWWAVGAEAIIGIMYYFNN